MARTIVIAGERYVEVPIRQYARPSGVRTDDVRYVPYTPTRAAKVDALAAADLHLTHEVIPGGVVSLCVEDDELDFASEIVPDRDDPIVRALAALVDDYEPAKYDRIRQIYHDQT